MPERMRFYDDLTVLPDEEPGWTIDRRTMTPTDEQVTIGTALRVLAMHAVEAGDRRSAGVILAAVALTGSNVAGMWQDCAKLFTTDLPYDGTYESASRRGADLDAQAREFFVSGIRRRPRRLLRSEARGLLVGLRGLDRAGLLDGRELREREHDPWRRREGLPAGAHPNIAGLLLAPASMN